MGLNEDRNDIAYVLGRLFSVLESIQKKQTRQSLRQFMTATLIPHVLRRQLFSRCCSN